MQSTLDAERPQENHCKSKTVCLALLSGYWYSATYSYDPAQFTVLDLFFTSLLLVAVLCVQAWALRLARHNRKGMDLLAGFFATCNIYVLYLSFAFEYLLLSDWYVQLALFALVLLLATLFFVSFANGKYWRKLVIGVSAALFAFNVALVAYFHLNSFLAYHQYLPAQTTVTGGMSSSPNVRLVEFTQTPNVYFLSFDAMLPEAAASELLDLPSLPYARTLEDKGFLRFVNYFSDTSHTKTTFASMYAFDPEYSDPEYSYSEYVSKINTGHERSPLREIFRFNGYQTNLYSLKAADFAYVKKGNGWDVYEIANPFTSVCFRTVHHPAYVLYGYCYFLAALIHRSYTLGNKPDQEYVGFFLDSVARQLEKGGRHLFFSYFKVPGHSDGVITSGQYAKIYRIESEKAAIIMEQIIAFVRENDPDAWLFFFSDHGTLMFTNHETIGRRKRVLDHYSGLAAFYPPQACQKHFVPRRWSTTSMITRDIVRCLAGGVDPFVNEVTYGKVEDEVDLADFLYE